MNIVMFGATGTLGSRILNELISRGYYITAVVRDPAKLAGRENVTGTSGDILNPDDVADAAEGADIVVSAYGPGQENPNQLVNATQSLIEGVKEAGAERLLTVGGAGTLQVAPGILLLDTHDFPAEYKEIARAHFDALEMLKGSGLNWTNLTPPEFIHPGERTGKYRVGGDDLLTDERGKSEISAEDFAIAVADEVVNKRHIRTRFTVAW
jgi:putative NADH-flavin reductase